MNQCFFFRVCVCGVASLKEWNNVEIFHDPTQEQFVQWLETIYWFLDLSGVSSKLAIWRDIYIN